MLTKEKRNKFRMIKYMAMIVALVAVFVLCLTACGKATPTKVEVSNQPTKTEYMQGESFDYTGAKVKVTYDNGKVEEIDVTADMVGTIVFDTVGERTVVIKFTAEGTTVEATLKVKVTDPYADKKAETIRNMKASSIVINNPSDNGLVNMLNQYVAAINAETSEKGIEDWAADFAAQAQTYLDKKAELLAKVDVDVVISAAAAKLNENRVNPVTIYEKYKPTAEISCTNAAKKIVAAANLDEAQSYVDEAIDNVYQYLKVQVYVDEKLNAEKINLLDEIKYYQEYGATLISILEGRNLTDSDPMYEAVQDAITKYNAAVRSLGDVYHYVLITEDLGEFSNVVADALAKLNDTPMYKICQLLEEGFDIVPAAWVYNTDTNAWEKAEDTVGKNIADLKKAIDDTKALFGDSTAAQKLLTNFEYDVLEDDAYVTKTVNLNTLYTTLKAKYDTRVAAQNAAAAVIAAINTATADGATEADILAAWTALQTWGATDHTDYDAMLSWNSTTTMINKALFDQKFLGTYSFADSFADYDMDQKHIVTYYVYNYEELLDTTASYDAEKIEDLVNAIGQIIYTNLNEDVDSNKAITAAEEAIAHYKATYGDEAYEQYCCTEVDGVKVDTLGDTVTEKRAAYEAKKTEVARILALIAQLPANATDIQVEDYADGTTLYDAYQSYVKFLKANTLEADRATYTAGTTFSDVLATDQTGNNANTHLVACMTEYVRQMSEDLKTLGVAELSVLFKSRLDNDFPNAETQANLRAQLRDLFNTQVGTVNGFTVTITPNALGTDLVYVEGGFVTEDATQMASVASQIKTVVDAAKAALNAFPTTTNP